MPSNARGVMSTLMTLLEDKPYLWPVTNADVLNVFNASMVAASLPAIRLLWIKDGSDIDELCGSLSLPLATPVRATVFYPQFPSTAWVANIVDLTIVVTSTPLDGRDLQKKLAARPQAKAFKLLRINFVARVAKTLAHALLSSKTLRTIKLLDVSNVLSAFLDPYYAPLPSQLRNLALDFTADWDDVPTLADKLAPLTIRSLDLRFDTSPDISCVLAVLPPTLRKLKVDHVRTTSFPKLPRLQQLGLWSTPLTDKAVADISALLAASTTLSRLNLAESGVPKDQLRTILYALPRCLSRQATACTARLPVAMDTEALVATVLFQTRNTQPFQSSSSDVHSPKQ
ncbi:hypothetical protein SDRG_08209 [Saprolegnia diclina VS20]|uniref:Uncharacterized protein n=1 Tax=Saprolegnia diclina (strain VS20) TaxID=1156394 RepID=T0QKW7_SAPDV|nr:hypothetical protein SDRG_08209 [Saprolegnia diclina VS20]EQC34440.1 hypothetical protein SDRG_08209 [Saprolegnia diclina VS20]|eukprot:XP_008612302.1 hypothetical protein SDRG_08209 [Saprolegnia diclina VS20]